MQLNPIIRLLSTQLKQFASLELWADIGMGMGQQFAFSVPFSPCWALQYTNHIQTIQFSWLHNLDVLLLNSHRRVVKSLVVAVFFWWRFPCDGKTASDKPYYISLLPKIKCPPNPPFRVDLFMLGSVGNVRWSETLLIHLAVYLAVNDRQPRISMNSSSPSPSIVSL